MAGLMTPRLSILILSIPKRKVLLGILRTVLQGQIRKDDPVEILVDPSAEGTIGAKRQGLLEKAKGDYIVFIDDDDMVNREYVRLILKALETNPDCVGITGRISGVGKPKRWFISKEHKEWHEANGIYYRHTNHLAPVKRELALQVGFRDKMFGEDFDYSMGLVGLLKTEVVIPTDIYHYRYNSLKKGYK